MSMGPRFSTSRHAVGTAPIDTSNHHGLSLVLHRSSDTLSTHFPQKATRVNNFS